MAFLKAWLLLGPAVVGAALACDGPTGISLDLVVTPNPVQIARGESVVLSVLAFNGAGEFVPGVSVAFRSSDTAIVTVTDFGLVRGKAIGQTSIIVSGRGAERIVPVIVHAVAQILLWPNALWLHAGDTARIVATPVDEFCRPITGVSVLWQSAHPLIASVNATGLVRAERSGTAYVRAQLENVFAFASVTVLGPTTIVVTPSDTTVDPGDSVQFRARVFDQFGDSMPGLALTWESSNTFVATVSAAGMARSAGGTGAVFIRARHDTIVGQARFVVRDTTILGQRVMVSGGPYGSSISATGVVTLGSGVSWLGCPTEPSPVASTSDRLPRKWRSTPRARSRM